MSIDQEPLTLNFYNDSSDDSAPALRAVQATYDATVLIAADRRKSLWASQVIIERGPSTRASGQAPRGASTHSLLAIALTSALGSIGGKRLSRIKSRNGNQKATILVLTDDGDFAAGIRQFIAGDKIEERFRAGRNLWHELLKKLRRHKITVDVVDPGADPRIGILLSWGKSAVIAPRESGFVPKVFLADAVSRTI